jgi:hypothetical protein
LKYNLDQVTHKQIGKNVFIPIINFQFIVSLYAQKEY